LAPEYRARYTREILDRVDLHALARELPRNGSSALLWVERPQATRIVREHCRVSPRPAPLGRRSQEERRAESSRRLLEAAIALFAERGYDATSAGAIAERAGYSRSLVNVRYGSKEGLLETILSTELEDRLLPAADASANGLDRLLAPVDGVLVLLDEDPRLLRAFFVVLFEAVGPVPALGSRVRAWLTRLEQATRRALEDGQRDGSVRSDADADAVIEEFAHLSVGLVYRWVLEGDEFDLAGALARWRRRLADACSPDRGTEDSR
jgi:AcrR family transcriptional regulator